MHDSGAADDDADDADPGGVPFPGAVQFPVATCFPVSSFGADIPVRCAVAGGGKIPTLRDSSSGAIVALRLFHRRRSF